MNKCEHGQKITHFCAHHLCKAPHPTGCSLCIEHHHQHGNDLLLSEEEVQAMVRKWGSEAGRTNCRLLQESLLNYFHLVKAEINSWMDQVCKNTINQIGYPFLWKQGLVNVFKRIKNKDYSKVSPKEFR